MVNFRSLDKSRAGSGQGKFAALVWRWALVLSVVFCTLAASADEQRTATSDAFDPAVAGGRKQAFSQLGLSPQYQGELKSLALINVRDAYLEQVLPPMDYPWAFEFINEDEILLTRISGKLLRINLRTKEEISLQGLPEIGKGFSQIGLMDIEIDPNFSENQRIYFSFAKPHPESGQYNLTEVASGVLLGNTISQIKLLINNQDFGWAPSNFGGVLEFDDKGHLFISNGDRGEEPLARQGDRLEGKLLRINTDGSYPADNPFVNKDGYDPRIYAMGLRNAQGLHFDSNSGILFEAEHGPLGGDEVNIIRPGGDYGWPTISYGANYVTAKQIGAGTHQKGLEQPIFYFLPSIATSAITVYRGEMFPEWNGHILLGALRGEHVEKLDYDNGIVRSSQAILSEVGGRIRDIKVANDGSIYILSQTSGLHRLYRKNSTAANLVAESSSGEAIHPGKEHYDLVCSGCHNSGDTGAPLLGNYEQWKSIISQSPELTRDHVVNGYKAMPERGLCNICSDAWLMEMVDYMFLEAIKNKK